MQKVVIQNFKCFCDKKYTFDLKSCDRIVFLEGRNGSGKSTFLEAIVWCLTDNNLRGNFIKPFKSAKTVKTTVEVFFDDFSVKRILTGNNSNITLRKKVESDSSFKEYVDPDYIKNFLNSKFNNNLAWYIRQSFPNVFLNATNTEKYELIFGVEEFNKNNPTVILEKIKAILKTKKEELGCKNSLKNSVKEKIQISRDQKDCFSLLSDKNESYLEDLKKSILKRKLIEEKKSSLEQKIKESEKRKESRDKKTDYFTVNKYSQIKADYEYFQDNYTQNYLKVKNYIDILQKFDERSKGSDFNIIEKFDERSKLFNIIEKFDEITNTQFLKPFFKDRTFSKKNIKQAFNSFLYSFYENNVKDCPKCKEKILFIDKDESDFIEKYIEKQSQLFQAKKVSFFSFSFSIKDFYNSKIKIFYKNLDQNFTVDLQSDTLFFNLSTHYSIYQKIKGKEEFLEKIKSLKDDIEEYFVSDKKEKELKAEYDSVLKEEKTICSVTEKNISYEDIVAYQNYKKIEDVSTTELEEEIKNTQELYEIILDASRLFLDTKLKAFEEKINYYLCDLFECDFKILLNIDTKKNFNSITVEFVRTESLEKEDEFSFDNIKFLSGGEYNKLNIAISLAFENSEILILDETLNSIDQDFKEKIIDVIREMNFRNVFFVSHSNISGGMYDFKIEF